MSHRRCRERTFPLWLSYDVEYHYSLYLTWLQQFASRFGREPALALWNAAFERLDELLLDHVLSSGWQESGEDRAAELATEIDGVLSSCFPAPIDGLSAGEAKAIIDRTPPFRQIYARFSNLDLVRETGTYEWLHFFYHGLALLAEEAIARHGKEGELVCYDALLEGLRGADRLTEVESFMERRKARFSTEPEEADMFSAGLEVELVRANGSEVVTRVVECEWARYYRERHPAVGYLLACSLDNAAYRSFNERIRLQRTTTLMEGGDHCDFCVYALDEAFAPQNGGP